MKSIWTRGGSRTCYISHICKSLFLSVTITAAAQLNSFESAAVSLCVGGYVKYCPWMLSGIWQPLDETLLICVFVCNDSCSQRLRQKTQLAENEQRRPWIFGESCWAVGFRGGFWSIWQDSAKIQIHPTSSESASLQHTGFYYVKVQWQMFQKQKVCHLSNTFNGSMIADQHGVNILGLI